MVTLPPPPTESRRILLQLFTVEGVKDHKSVGFPNDWIHLGLLTLRLVYTEPSAICQPQFRFSSSWYRFPQRFLFLGSCCSKFWFSVFTCLSLILEAEIYQNLHLSKLVLSCV